MHMYLSTYAAGQEHIQPMPSVWLGKHFTDLPTEPRARERVGGGNRLVQSLLEIFHHRSSRYRLRTQRGYSSL